MVNDERNAAEPRAPSDANRAASLLMADRKGALEYVVPLKHMRED
jgi:hypothetical protein